MKSLTWPVVFCLRAVMIAACAVCPGTDRQSEPGPAQEAAHDDSAGFPGTLIIRGGDTSQGYSELPRLGLIGGSRVMIVRNDSAESAVAAREAEECLGDLGLLPQIVLRAVTPVSSDSGRAADSRVTASLAGAEVVWIVGGSADTREVSPLPDRLPENLRKTLPKNLGEELQDVLKRGGVVVAPAAALPGAADLMITGAGQKCEIRRGLRLLPGTVMAVSSGGREQDDGLIDALRTHPDCFGIAIDRDAALIVSGRRMRASGSGQVRLYLPLPNLPLPKAALAEVPEYPAVIRLSGGDQADLTQIRRAVLARAAGCWQISGPPAVACGAVVLVGGGELPAAAADRFLELAGGSEAVIAILPLGMPPDDRNSARILPFMTAAKEVFVLSHGGAAAVSSSEFRNVLNQATGLWFGGGRQWRFVDAYEGTEALQLFHGILRRGGVIGGTSAGATIQGDYLVRGHPLGNSIMMAEGYEHGFAFLPGTAIDQHFSQRGRQADLSRVIGRFPALLGIGIDEGTAVVVRGTRAEILGRHAVHFVSTGRRDPRPEDGGDAYVTDLDGISVLTVPAGRSIDLSAIRSRQPEKP